MLSRLSIKNYALIDRLDVSFANGFTCITGETGAGKSILLGGLSLVLGKRADLSTLRNKDEKCIIEGEFEINNYHLSKFFTENDLDYEDTTIIRREILPSGKSRAFINDTPVNLDVLSRLGSRLIDIHSQHQTLQLAENEFQFKVIDSLANNKELLIDYSNHLKTHQNRLSQTLTINPQQWSADESKSKKFWSHFYNQTSYLIDRKVKRDGNNFNLNPFESDAKNQLGLKLNFRNVFFLNRGKQRYTTSYTYISNKARNVLSFGFIENGLQSHQFNFNHKIAETWLMTLQSAFDNNEMEIKGNTHAMDGGFNIDGKAYFTGAPYVNAKVICPTEREPHFRCNVHLRSYDM